MYDILLFNWRNKETETQTETAKKKKKKKIYTQLERVLPKNK